MSTFYRSVWISDLHLASRECQADLVHSFLDSIKCDYLYLVGDIIDVWTLRQKWHWPRQYNEVVNKLLKRSRKGAQVVYIPGNHDEFFRGFVGIRFGDIVVKKRDIHTTADGKRLLITHGDEFDTIVRHRRTLSLLATAAHQHLIRLNQAVNFIRRLIGLRDWSLSATVARRMQEAFRHLRDYEDLWWMKRYATGWTESSAATRIAPRLSNARVCSIAIPVTGRRTAPRWSSTPTADWN
jgi:UDP-2,3-diacylglucosamine pyrophosphatase LpxH